MSHRNLYAKLDDQELAYVLGLELACAVPDTEQPADAMRRSTEVPDVPVTLHLNEVEWSQITKSMRDQEAMRAEMSAELQTVRGRLHGVLDAVRNFLAELQYNHDMMPSHNFRGEFYREWEDLQQLIERQGQKTL